MSDSPGRSTAAPLVVRAAAAVAMLIGSLVLVGWFAGVGWLTNGGSKFATTKANAAVACILAGFALGASSRRSPRTRAAGQFSALALIALALAVLSQYFSGQDLGIDQLLVRDTATVPGVGTPGRMGAATACLFLLVGLELLLLNAGRFPRATQVAGWFLLGLAFIPYLGYLYGANELYSAHPFTTMALPTVIVLLTLCAGILAAVPEYGLVRYLTGPGVEGTFCRRLVPAAILVPVVFGWIRMEGQRAGLYDTEFGLALYASSNVVAFLALIFWNARWLAGTDAARRAAADELRELNATLERRVEERTRALDESERRFQAIFHSQFEFIGLMALDGTVLEANRTALRAAGATEADVIGKPFWETAWWAHDPAQRERLKAAVARAADGEHDRFEATHPTPDGGILWIDFSLTPFHDSSGTVTFLIPEGRDITDRKAFERRLGEQEERFRSAFDYAAIGMALVAPDGRWLRVNRSLCDLLGYSETELLASDFQTITHPEDLESDLQFVRQVLSGELRTYQMEKRYFRKTGETVHVILAVSLVRESNGTPLYFISQIKDITQRKLAEQKVAESLKEKEILLREIHHRVKNNLAVIGSLFFLQSTRTRDSETLLMLEECQNRIRAMSLVHESLYQSDDLAAVNFGEYARNLGNYLLSTYLLAPGTVGFHVAADEVRLDIDRAIPCGLILNELIANALKHAFPNGRTGVIRLTLEKRDGGKLLMSVADNGIGVSEGANVPSTRSLGLRLIHSLSRQLDAHFEMVRLETGTDARLTLELTP